MFPPEFCTNNSLLLILKRTFIMAVIWVVSSCQSANRSADTEQMASDTVLDSDSLNIGGISPTTYKGILPCSDCAGIETTLELFFDSSKINNTYQLTETRLHGGRGEPKITRGEFVTLYFNDSSVVIYRLNPEDPSRARFFRKIDSHKIMMMTDDPSAREVSAENFILTRQ